MHEAGVMPDLRGGQWPGLWRGLVRRRVIPVECTPVRSMIHTAMNMVDHRHCLALSGCFRGKLCEQLMNRPGRPVAKGLASMGRVIRRRACFIFGGDS